MNWITNYVRPTINSLFSRREVPENLWQKCNECGTMLFHRELSDNLNVCTNCDHHMAIKLSGKTAHAANPEDGTSPALAISTLIPQLDSLGVGGVLDDAFKLVTITHVNIGAPTFGIAPADAVIYATLRTADDAGITALEEAARTLAAEAAKAHGLKLAFEVHDHFAASINDTEAYEVAVKAMDTLGISHSREGVPMRASEDFGVFGWGAKAAMLCLGPGEGYAALHNPDYDFPDDLIPLGSALFARIAHDLLSEGTGLSANHAL